MSHRERKDRKLAKIKFEKAPKIGTPLESRSWFAGLVQGPYGTPSGNRLVPRSEKKRRAAMQARGLLEGEADDGD